MKYQSLRQLSFGDEKKYAQAYRDRFDSPCSVKLDFSISGNQAFFLVNAEVLELAFHIAKMDKQVYKLSSRLPGIARTQYSKKCLIDEIVLTNKIEGVHSSRKEINEALDILEQQSSQKKGPRKRFEGLVNKYLLLMTADKISLSTCQDIRNIYDELFLNEVIAESPQNKPDGKIFRKELTEIQGVTGKVIHKGLYPEKKIINAMDKALFILNDDSIEGLFKICIFHYLFEYIHPFYDGNGRMGRFILSYCLSETLEKLLAYRISETIKENISKYYKAFEICNDYRNLGDLTPFLLMLLNMILLALDDLEASLNRKLSLWNKYEKFVSSVISEKNADLRELYSYLIQAALFSEGGISTAELQEQFNCSYYLINKLLKLVPRDHVIVKKKGRANCYQINLEVFDNLMLKDELNKKI